MELVVVWLVSPALSHHRIRLTKIRQAAIAANLTTDVSMIRAVKMGCRYVEAGIRYSKDIGQGNGPINHFHSLSILPFSPCVIAVICLVEYPLTSLGVISSSIFLRETMLSGHGKIIPSMNLFDS